MAPPTGLNIKTSSVIRLVKEEKSYHNELVLQTSLLTRLESGEEIEGYDIKQQVCPSSPARIAVAHMKLLENRRRADKRGDSTG